MRIKSSLYMKEEEFPFWIDHRVHTARNTPPIHAHDFIELVYVTEGEAEHLFEGEHYPLSKGDVFIINPGEVHTYKVNPGNELGIVNCLFMPSLFDEAWLRGLGISESMDYFYVHPFLEKCERFHRCLKLRGQEAEDMLDKLEELLDEFESKRNGYSPLIRLQLVQLLILLSRIYVRRNVTTGQLNVKAHERKMFIQRICGYLERHYDQKITIANLAELFSISTRHLNRIFKAETGKTVIEFIHHIRITRAMKLLTETNEKVITIAMDVGYDDPAFFTRLFTRKAGCSPGKYREESNVETLESELSGC